MNDKKMMMGIVNFRSESYRIKSGIQSEDFSNELSMNRSMFIGVRSKPWYERTL